MATDHDRIVTTEGNVTRLSGDVETLKADVEVLKLFKAKAEAMVSLGKWQLAVTLGNGALLAMILWKLGV